MTDKDDLAGLISAGQSINLTPTELAATIIDAGWGPVDELTNPLSELRAEVERLRDEAGAAHDRHRLYLWAARSDTLSEVLDLIDRG